MSNSRISNNIIANVYGVFGQLIIAFLLSPFLVKTLGDTKYGIWVIAVAFTGYMNLMDFGISSAVNKYVASYDGLKNQSMINAVVSTSMVLFLLMGLTVVLLSPLMADLVVSLITLDEDLTSTVHLLIIIVSFDIGIFIVGGLYKGIFGGFQHYAIINYVQLIAAIYKALMFYLFLSNGFELLSMGLVSISANVFVIILFRIALQRVHPLVKFDLSFINKFSAAKILHFSKFTFLAMVANQIIFYSDAFVIGYFLSAAAVTYYSIPWTLSEYTKKISHAISQSYAPAVSEKDATGDLKSINRFYLSGTRYMIIVSNLLSIGVIILGGAFIAIWMGPKYKDLCETVLIILFINQYFQGPQQIGYSILKGLAKQRLYSYMSIVVSMANLALSIALVQRMGIVGVALGAAIPQILFHGIFVPWLTLRTLGISGWDYFKKTYLLSAVPTIGLFSSLIFVRSYNFPNSYIELLSTAMACTSVYLLLVYYFMLNKAEQNLLTTFFRNKARQFLS